MASVLLAPDNKYVFTFPFSFDKNSLSSLDLPDPKCLKSVSSNGIQTIPINKKAPVYKPSTDFTTPEVLNETFRDLFQNVEEQQQQQQEKKENVAKTVMKQKEEQKEEEEEDGVSQQEKEEESVPATVTNQQHQQMVEQHTTGFTTKLSKDTEKTIKNSQSKKNGENSILGSKALQKRRKHMLEFCKKYPDSEDFVYAIFNDNWLQALGLK